MQRNSRYILIRETHICGMLYAVIDIKNWYHIFYFLFIFIFLPWRITKAVMCGRHLVSKHTRLEM